jgi:N-acetyl-anhydromuramyl-L-alanine amidase AmpD
MRLKPEQVEYLVVHCSATTPDMDIGVAEIDRWHRQRGWLKVGYHYVIRRDGTVETGRRLDEVGAHAQGVNEKSIGICLVGGARREGRSRKLIDDPNFTPAQWAALKTLLTTLKGAYPKAVVVGHRDLTARKTCPTFDAGRWWAENTSKKGETRDEPPSAA